MGGTRKLKVVLRLGVAALLIASSGPIVVGGQAIAQEAPAEPVIEENRYALRLMLQTFDGKREFSHAQDAGFARMRRGDESWVEVDFGSGAVTIDEAGRKQVGSFRNDSDSEIGLRYDYATKTLEGDSAVARHHNRFVRPMLGFGPALGSDARWRTSLTLDQLGMFTRAEQHVTLELSRRYFTHDGKEMVLLHYRVPSFVWVDHAGRSVAQWGEGIALTDPGFGQVYWNAALHRAVAQPIGGEGHPYRFAKTIVALDERGKPMIDPRAIPQAAGYVERFYGASNEQILGFVTAEAPDQSPLELANLIDIMAMSMAEDSANQLGELTGAYTNGTRGREQPDNPPATIRQTAETANQAFSYYDKGKVVLDAALQQLDPELQVIALGLANYKAEGAALATKLANAEQAFERARQALAASKTEYELSAKGQALFDDVLRAEKNAIFAHETVRAARAEGAVVTDVMKQTVDMADRSLAAAEDVYQASVRNGTAMQVVQTAAQRQQAEALKVAARNVEAVKDELATYGRVGANITTEIQSLPQSKFTRMVQAFDDSLVGKSLTGLAHTMNALTIANGIVNTGTALTSNQASGQLQLTRDYGGASNIFIGLGLDFVGLAGNAVTGNAAGFFSDAAAISIGSIGDIIISAKGALEAQKMANALSAENARMRAELARKERLAYEKASDERRKQMEDDLAESREELDRLKDGGLDAEIEDAKRKAQAALEARRKAREEAERQAEQERQRVIEQARIENERKYQEQLKRPPTPEEWAKFNADIAAAMEPDYPTAPPPSPEELEERLRRAEEKRLAEARAAAEAADAELALIEAEAAERKRLQDEALQASLDAKERREKELEELRKRNDEREKRRLEVTPFDITPVTFDPPVWDPPKWDPPEWVPPEFDPPEISDLPWTNFSDDDWPNVGNLAFDYGDMSGIVETDLSRWAEWLATQDIRHLERLADQAGYPNLASALADAHNIIRQSQDEGYRRWALQAPSCGGTVGCGPSYIERWAMKSSIVALGDILNKSRDIFSSGGLSDVSVSGLTLAYLLRDYSLEDGDIIDVVISQFGRDVVSRRVTLTNAGETFRLPLARGLAKLVVTAVNEGFSSPNTAEVKLENVIQGEALQTYSLRTGEFATQRIEVGATASGER